MATGRIGVTPTLRTRWSKQPSAGTTSLSGLDDNSVSLVYDVGYEAVYRNGVLLSRGNDYTATSGTSITLIDATLTGDVIEVLANQLVPLTDAISKGQFTAKGALLSATAASTPGVITVGANDTVLTADSTTSTGLKWATPAAGGMTLISTTSITGTSTTLSSIPQTYTNLQLIISGLTWDTSNALPSLRFNGSDTPGVNYAAQRSATNISRNGTEFWWLDQNWDRTNGNDVSIFNIYDYANTTRRKTFQFFGACAATTYAGFDGGGIWDSTSALTSIQIYVEGRNITSGTALLYGVK